MDKLFSRDLARYIQSWYWNKNCVVLVVAVKMVVRVSAQVSGLARIC